MEIDESSRLGSMGSAVVFIASCLYTVNVARHCRSTDGKRSVVGTTTRTAEKEKAASSSLSVLSKTEILALREKHFSSSLSVSYANSNPLLIVGVSRHDSRKKEISHVVVVCTHSVSSVCASLSSIIPCFSFGAQGQGSRLIDETGTSYLDTRNNVAHCGHNNPRIVRAVQDQVATLNTNTRYLHPNMALLAQRLAALLPDPLEVVFFCNSGSEANDMALRLARAYSGGSTNTIVGKYVCHDDDEWMHVLT